MTAHVQPPSIEITEAIRICLEKTFKSENISDDIKERCLRVLNLQKEIQDSTNEDKNNSRSGDDPVEVPISLIRDIYLQFRNKGLKMSLHELVEGSKLFLQPPVLSPPNPELVARIQQLKIEEENREYRRMTQNVDPTVKKQFRFQDDVKVMNRQLTGVLNFILTVVAGFAFGYKAVEYSYGSNFALQMMSGLIAATVIFFVDLYFMVKYAPI